MQFDLLARGLAARGHRVVVVSRASPGGPTHERLASGVEVWRIGVPIARKRVMGRTLDRILHARAVARKVAELDSVRPFDVFEGPVASLDAERIVADPRFSRRTLICCHGSNFMGQAVGGPLAAVHRFDWRWSGRREQASLRRVPRVVVSSLFTRQYVVGQGIEDRKIETVPLGVDTQRFFPAPGRISRHPVVVGFAGRLEEVKGIDFVWRVLDAVGPDTAMRFVFKGNIHPSTRAEVLERFKTHNAIAEYQPAGTHDEMPEFFRSLDVLLLPSRVENFGLTYTEAMASGLIVFAGPGGAGAEAVQDGVTGFLVDPDGPVTRVVDTLRAIAADPSAFDGMRGRARDHVVRHLSIERFIDAKEQQYLRGRSQ